MAIPQTTSNGEQEPLPPPEQLFQLLKDKKERFAKMPEKSQERFLHTAFRFYIQPKLTKMGVQGKDLDEARVKFTTRMRGQKTEPLSKDFGKPPAKEEDKPDIISSTAGAGYAKLAGMVGHLADWDAKLDRLISGKNNKRDAVGRIIDKVGQQAKFEESLYDVAKEAHPTAAKAGALGADAFATGPLFKGAGMATQALKNPLLRHALSGAAGMAASTPLYSSSAQDVPKNAAYGAAGGALLGPLMEMLSGRMSRGAGSAASKAAPTVEAKAAAAPAQTGFKSWMDMSPEEQTAVRERARAATKKGTRKSATSATAPPEGTPTPVAPKDSATKSSWRSQQYIKLKRAGVDPQSVRDQVHAGRTAEEILAARSGQQAGDLGSRTAHIGIATQETPEVEKAVKGVSAAAKVGEVAPTVVPEGQHGSGTLGKNAKKAEREAAARAQAAAARPSTEVGYEGSGKEGAGTPVPIAPTQVPIVDIMSGLKNLKTKGMSGERMYKMIEAAPKFKAMPDEEKRAALEKMYQAIGEKLGIEGAENMSLDELYVRVTSGH